MDLMALADFNAVALYGGFGPAARALDRPKATLSRRVADLEKALGVRLIERGARQVRLTEEGHALFQRTKGLIAEIQEAGAALTSEAPVARGKLRISAPIVFAHVVLCQIAAKFAQTYPHVELEVTAEDRLVDPVEDGYDLVIRINPSADEQLIGRRILTDQRILVSTTPFVETPSIPAVLMSSSASEAWQVVFGDDDFAGATVSDNHKVRTIIPRPLLRLSSLMMVREAVLTGVGAALLPRLLVARDLADGRLHSWGTDAGPPVEIWALYHSRRLLSTKVRAFLDMLQEELTETAMLQPL